MEVEFARVDLARLEVEKGYAAGYDAAAVRGFRKVMQAIRAAQDERDLYALRGFHMEKLVGKRQHQHSLRLNDQWRLIIEVSGRRSDKTIRVVTIEDYH
jgi:toxin HigB-1